MRARLASLLILVAVGCGDDDTPDAGLDDERWNAFVAEREDYLRELAVPITACVARDDTGYPVFHGCYDWHSAVHGVWALLALARLTDDPAYTAAADAVLEPSRVADELALLQTGAVSFELPYGYAWFLRLARERAAAGATDLEPLAAQAADDLEAWLLARTPAELEAYAQEPAYNNLSWAVLNLHQYAGSVGDAERAQRIVDFAREHLVPLDAACPLDREATLTDQFFPPCLHRALALLAILPDEEAADWLAGFTPPEYTLAPITEPLEAHAAGLDFSRAWGLWALWSATRDLAYLHLYLDHVETWMALPQYWADNYDYYSHWVPQFGVYAIAQSYESD